MYHLFLEYGNKNAGRFAYCHILKNLDIFSLALEKISKVSPICESKHKLSNRRSKSPPRQRYAYCSFDDTYFTNFGCVSPLYRVPEDGFNNNIQKGKEANLIVICRQPVGSPATTVCPLVAIGSFDDEIE